MSFLEKLNSTSSSSYIYSSSNSQDLITERALDELSKVVVEDKTSPKQLILYKIFQSVRYKIVFSPNYPHRDDKFQKHLEKLKQVDKDADDHEIFEEFTDEYDDIRDLKDNFYKSNPKILNNKFLFVLSSAQIHRNFWMGNCDDNAIAAFYSLINDKNFKRIEILALLKKDHAIVLLDRDENSDLDDYTKWGKECLVFDTWSRENNIFSAIEIPLYLKGFKELDAANNPILLDFVPHQDQFGIIASNIFSVSEYRSKVDFGIEEDVDFLKWFLDQVEKFNITNNPQEKSEIAKKIIHNDEKMTDPRNKIAIKELKSQMLFYLDPSYADVYEIGMKNPTRPFENYEMDENMHQNFLPKSTVLHLVKTAQLFQKNDLERAYKKYYKLPDLLTVEQILPIFEQLSQDPSNQRMDESDLLMLSIYSFIVLKINYAIDNQRNKEAFKIFALLPEDIQANFSDNFEFKDNELYKKID